MIQNIIILQYINTYTKQEKSIVSLLTITQYILFNLENKGYKFLCHETMDQDYIRLLNKDLINEAILNHLWIEFAKHQYSFQQLENKNRTSYLRMIYVIIITINSFNHVNRSINQIEKIKDRIRNEEAKQQVYFFFKNDPVVRYNRIDQKFKLLDFLLNILQRTKNGQLKVNYILDYFVSLEYNKLLLQSYINKQQDFTPLISGLIICVQEILCLREFDKFEIVLIVQGLISKEKQLLKAFDYYHSNLLKNITASLANYVFSQIGKHQKQQIEKKFKLEDAQSIFDDLVESSSIKSLNGVTHYLDALAIFNAFETEHKCIDIIRRAIMEDQ
ncbi:unnamed protein product [Paramecium octaurelia]|uniref:Uncharacterized protein n=1 Tax=Paramecium octaurelia TaxID=43137 RepID=A0A8S1YNF8_PAROT|nr:unnamed protein product [Paramecium octaurelia]